MKLKPAVRTSALIHLTETIAHVFPSCALCNYKVIFINAILKKKKPHNTSATHVELIQIIDTK